MRSSLSQLLDPDEDSQAQQESSEESGAFRKSSRRTPATASDSSAAGRASESFFRSNSSLRELVRADPKDHPAASTRSSKELAAPSQDPAGGSGASKSSGDAVSPSPRPGRSTSSDCVTVGSGPNAVSAVQAMQPSEPAADDQESPEDARQLQESAAALLQQSRRQHRLSRAAQHLPLPVPLTPAPPAPQPVHYDPSNAHQASQSSSGPTPRSVVSQRVSGALQAARDWRLRAEELLGERHPELPPELLLPSGGGLPDVAKVLMQQFDAIDQSLRLAVGRDNRLSLPLGRKLVGAVEHIRSVVNLRSDCDSHFLLQVVCPSIVRILNCSFVVIIRSFV